MVAVEEDELAGHQDESLRGVAAEGLVATEQQLRQLAGIAAGGFVVELAGGVEGDASLGGVADDEADLGLVGKGHEGLVLGVEVQRAADDVDAVEAVDDLAVQLALQVHVVEAVLAVQPVHHALLDGLYHDHAGVEVGATVHVPDDPVNKAAQKVAFAELDDSLGCTALRSCSLVQCFHRS